MNIQLAGMNTYQFLYSMYIRYKVKTAGKIVPVLAFFTIVELWKFLQELSHSIIARNNSTIRRLSPVKVRR
ncbi:hypothetical protein [Paenibacillus sp. FSL K6-1230]|uniref:hypothetical protein n=1 Tax=Paenibacillus sp. FSL K6-1230 TaxID=2921603 RepID=UPI0030F73B14